MPSTFTGESEPVTLSSASLVILSLTTSAAEIGRALSIEPTETWNRGDVGEGGGPQAYHGWVRASGLGEDRPIEEHLAVLLDHLVPHSHALAELLQAKDRIDNAKLWVVSRSSSWNPGLSLSPNLLSALADLGVDLEIDIYVMESQAPAT